MHLRGHHNHAPTRHLARALERAAPGLFDRAHAWEQTTVALMPLCTAPHQGQGACDCPVGKRAGRAGWYEVCHTTPAVVIAPETAGQEIAYTSVGERVALLPPPPLLPFAERLAAVPRPRLDLTPAQVAFYGGPDQIARDEEFLHQQAAAQHTSTSYDWETYAAQILPTLHAVKPQALKEEVYVDAAHARLWAAEGEVASAQRSLEDRLAADPVRLDRVGASRTRLVAAEQQVAVARSLLAHLEGEKVPTAA